MRKLNIDLSHITQSDVDSLIDILKQEAGIIIVNPNDTSKLLRKLVISKEPQASTPKPGAAEKQLKAIRKPICFPSMDGAIFCKTKTR